MYSHDYLDWLVPNAPAGAASAVGWCDGTVNWGMSIYNTNIQAYKDYVLGPYVQNPNVYKCPNDTLPSDNGDRIRSISMNGALTGDLPVNFQITIQGYVTAAWRIYKKMGDLTYPKPVNMIVFIDEAMWSLEDGYMQPKFTSPDYPNPPANYDCGGACISFADGHGQYRKWLWPGIGPASPTVAGSGLRTVTYAKGIPATPGTHWGSAGTDVDWEWLRGRMSALQGVPGPL
jgi:hypothetical protein